MEIFLPDAALTAIRKLNQSGYEAYAVGGCIRDFLLGREPGDWDITTNALPEEIQEVFRDFRVIPTGIRHGTVTVIIEDAPLEITTYRVDGSYSDHRHPDEVVFTRSLREDLQRRDFTINALAYHPDEGILDYFSGLADLSRRALVCVGDPEKRFSEDALRILRGIRFSAQLEFSVEKKTAEAMHKLAPLLNRISAERIAEELEKTLCAPGVKNAMLSYPDIFSVVVPELADTVLLGQSNRYHYLTVYGHTAEAVAAIAPLPVLRWTMLFHDCGKPACHVRDEDGTDHFRGHAAVGATMAEKALERLHLDRHTIDTVKQLVAYHDDMIYTTDTQFRHLLNQLGPDHAMMLFAVIRADTLAKTPDTRQETLQMLDAAESRLRELVDQHACFSLRDLAVSGEDLQRIGFIPGRSLGETLQHLLDDVMEERVANDKNTLLQWARRYKNG